MTVAIDWVVKPQHKQNKKRLSRIIAWNVSHFCMFLGQSLSFKLNEHTRTSLRVSYLKSIKRYVIDAFFLHETSVTNRLNYSMKDSLSYVTILIQDLDNGIFVTNHTFRFWTEI